MHCPCNRRYTRRNDFAGLPAPQDILPYVCAHTAAGTQPLVLITRADWHPDDRFVLQGSFAPVISLL